MKRLFFDSRILIVWLLSGYVFSMNAQPHIAMPYNNGAANFTLNPPSVCSYTFSDNGGANNPYSSYSGNGSVVTFWPSSPGHKVVVQFYTFHTEALMMKATTAAIVFSLPATNGHRSVRERPFHLQSRFAGSFRKLVWA